VRGFHLSGHSGVLAGGGLTEGAGESADRLKSQTPSGSKVIEGDSRGGDPSFSTPTGERIDRQGLGSCGFS
jgi:hypothetical protein